MAGQKKFQYFLGLIPPPPFADAATALKAYFKDRYHSKAALNAPPHITLHMPFEWREERESELVSDLSAFASLQPPFQLRLGNFGCFEPRVIFIDVIPEPALNKMQKELSRFCRTKLNLFNALYQDLPFHPHLTLAFRDLKKPMFRQAWEEFRTRKFEATFTVNGIALLKHDRKQWNLYRQLNFANG